MIPRQSRGLNHAPIALAALLAALLPAFAWAAPVLLPTGEPDPNCPDIRLWLRADEGIKDAQGKDPNDPNFDGHVAEWKDRSADKFDLTAMPGRPPLFVPRQVAAGNRPTVSFSGRQMLMRGKDPLHDRPNSTTIIVFQGKAGGENCLYTLGNSQERMLLSFTNEIEPALNSMSVNFNTTGGARGLGLPLELPRDGRAGNRFGIVIFTGDEDQKSLEYHDGLGDWLGEQRDVIPLAPVKSASDQCRAIFYLGGGMPQEPHLAFNGQIAEMLVLNRGLASTERLELLSYLRRRYEMDMTGALLPPGNFLVQAEDFDGNWQRPPRNPSQQYLGGRHAVLDLKAGVDEGLKKTITIARDGKYHVWVRALENGFQQGGSGLKTFVQGKELAVTHVRGPRAAICWREAGDVDLKAGAAEIIIRAEGPGVKDCDAVLISPTIDNIDAIEEFCALAQRLRGIAGSSPTTALFTNGLRLDGSLLTGWHWTDSSGPRPRPADADIPPLQYLQFNRNTTNPGGSFDAVLEFHNGDRLRGVITGFVPASAQAGQTTPAQLLVRPPLDYFRDPKLTAAVEIEWVRRIVFEPAEQDRGCPPQTLICRDGRKFSFRAIRWGAESLGLLTEDGLVRLNLSEVAELRTASSDPWEMFYKELAVINPDGAAKILRVATSSGSIFTASTSRSSQLRVEPETMASRRLLQPAWSLNPIPVPWSDTREIWRTPEQVVPLSRFVPDQTVQRSSLGSSWKWQANRNVAGGPLNSGGQDYLWGFGVHAPNGLLFNLPACAAGFRSSVGIDTVVGNAGSANAKVFLNQATGTPLYQSTSLVGLARPVTTGDIALPATAGNPRRLLLTTENASDPRGPSGIPLDIGNHVDWLEPVLLLDPATLRAEVAKRRPAAGP